ncbi:MAG TPA: hypothetical protein VMR75_03140 [Candidatus Saccharimonadales bacterium]|nr:hypothetical protein [Candidatus Saccharimonadales bacterium]
MADVYPEWIQEQLDKIAHQPRTAAGDAGRRQTMALAAIESRIISYLAYRLDRLEAKIDRLLAYCEEG